MKKLHTLPQRVCESTCYVNGSEDLLVWKGADHPDFLTNIEERAVKMLKDVEYTSVKGY